MVCDEHLKYEYAVARSVSCVRVTFFITLIDNVHRCVTIELLPTFIKIKIGTVEIKH